MDDTSDTKPEQQIPESNVPADLHIELPFPMLIMSYGGRFLVVARITDNKIADLGVLDLAMPEDHHMNGKPIASLRIAFGPTPENVQVGDYWQKCMGESAQMLFQKFIERFNQTVAVPQKVIHGINGNTLKVVQ